MNSSPALLIGLCALILWLTQWLVHSRRSPLPPGPKTWPLVGNLLDVPKAHPWLVYDGWAKQYGDILSLNVMGRTIIILNSSQATQDLFEKDASVYSDRPHSVVINELMEFPRVMGVSHYGEHWRRQRRAFHQMFSPSMVEKYQPVTIRESRKMVQRLLADPDHFQSHIRLALGAAMMEVTYGIRVSGWDDRYLSTAERVARHFMEALVPVAFLVERIPFLKYVPAWFPFAGFRRKMAKWREDVQVAFRDPYEYVKESMGRGGTSALAALLVKSQDAKEPQEEDIAAQYAMASVYIDITTAGVDTTISAIHSFLLAMMLYPDKQKAAQAELDRVAGDNGLPDSNDRTNLPYVKAVMTEVLRWRPPVPLALPHTSSCEGVYKGYHIPAGSTIFANARSILHDPLVYPEPDEFIPERFITNAALDLKGKDPVASFGLGRRICPGRWFSEASFYSIASHLLATFTILDEDADTKDLRTARGMTSEVIS
ncbi:cytochrome P450 [Gloeophyllum trabeum ATCC 11539]|uniref:Cytochrome P450 n=1 Tax=Gloeophyllum trabeum (strain ATCC 11539 / FP-39264 / Madison 617) TaxID=670483 RepID=S7Q5L5_GLOTA|nr:cytochrome P450 [Gloeophyllum trabeum ATCC 11539]EPQ55346.1 cytochrome P450 [Gloeophyllum trabeum ATCC 11539]